MDSIATLHKHHIYYLWQGLMVRPFKHTIELLMTASSTYSVAIMLSIISYVTLPANAVNSYWNYSEQHTQLVTSVHTAELCVCTLHIYMLSMKHYTCCITTN